MRGATHETDVAIIGGGIIGLSAAYFLASSGRTPPLSVMVLEAGKVGAQASGVNAGNLCLQNKPPLLTPTCLLAHELWRDMDSSPPGGLELLHRGGLLVAQTEEEEKELAARFVARTEGGLPLCWLDRGELRARYPWLSTTVRAASFNPMDGHAGPLRTVFTILQAARDRGVRVVQDCPVSSAEPRGSGWLLEAGQGRVHAETVIIAAGGWADVVGSSFGCYIPVERKVPQLSVTERLHFQLLPIVVQVNGHLSIRQSANGQGMIGGGWEGVPLEPDYRRTALRLDRVVGNLALAASVVPSLEPLSIVRMWSAMEGMSPDRLPYLGQYSGKPGLLFAVEGYGGFTLGMAFARMVTDAYLGRGEALPEWAAPDRFARAPLITAEVG